ncbi:MAG: helix-turn-helix transcriptional regulator [Oscillospiraceae bacterium]|nr:helix-turn-helix transcriptional regulator [Oscillospiraceae bacterium]
MIYPSICTQIQGVNKELPIMIDVNCRRKSDSGHFHNYLQICYVLAGTSEFSINGDPKKLNPGECAVAVPYTPHNLNTAVSEDTPITVMISFKDSFLTSRGYSFFSHSPEYANFEGEKIPVFHKFDGERKTRADFLIREIIAEFSRHFDMSFDQLAEYLAQFFDLLCTEEISIEDEKAYDLLRERTYSISESIKYMASHYMEKITIDELSSISAMSRSIYMDNFKSITGLSPIKFLTLVRVSQARIMLIVSNKSVTEIANCVGFYDKSRLIHAFKEVYGISPQAMKNAFEQSIYDTHENHLRRWSWFTDTDEE